MSGRVINTRSKAVEQARGCVARKIGLAGMVKKDAWDVPSQSVDLRGVNGRETRKIRNARTRQGFENPSQCLVLINACEFGLIQLQRAQIHLHT
jgi:hypothetical protein